MYVESRGGVVAGELLCIGWSFSKPHAHFFRLDKEGRLQVDVPIDLPEPVFVHDMAFTKACPELAHLGDMLLSTHLRVALKCMPRGCMIALCVVGRRTTRSFWTCRWCVNLRWALFLPAALPCSTVPL